MEIIEYKPEDIGKYFMVPCALMECEGGEPYYLPIIGPEHKDKQFSVEFMHYHIDGRFMNKHHIRSDYFDQNGRTNLICSKAQEGSSYMMKEIVTKRMKLKRLTTGLRLRATTPSIVHSWAKSMIGKSCAGKKCPHLGTKMFEQEGHLVCPLHNLVGSIKDEVITGIYHD